MIDKKGIFMKKMVMMLLVVLSSSMSYAFNDSLLAQQENQTSCRHALYADQIEDEYMDHNDDQSDIDEYDQHVCDDVQAPKISAAKALLAELVGAMIIQYLVMKEIAHIYLKDFKDVLNQWFNKIAKL